MIRDDLKVPLTMLKQSFLKKLDFKGSYNGKRFLFRAIKNAEDKNITGLKVFVWKDLFNFENTDDNDKITKDFAFTDEGIDEGLTFVEETKV